jgi:hypothetical protein
MATPRKYNAPCSEHALFTRACKHCTAWAARMRRIGGPQVPRAKRLGTTGKTWTMPRTWVRRRKILRLRCPTLSAERMHSLN